MKKLKLTYILGLSMALFSCSDDDVLTGDDNIYADFQIPTIPSGNYLVGAHYVEWDASGLTLPESPDLGDYNGSPADQRAAYSTHVSAANGAGLDYFIFPVSASFNHPSADELNGNSGSWSPTTSTITDAITYISNLQSASGASSMNYALALDLGPLALSATRLIDVDETFEFADGDVVISYLDAMEADLLSLAATIGAVNYQQVDSKPVLYIKDSDKLTASDYATVSTLFDEFYVIAEQPAWTPPMRFVPRFDVYADAMTPKSHIYVSGDFDRLHFFKEYTYQYFEFSETELESNSNLAFVPHISPSVNPQILDANAAGYQIVKNEDFFRVFCNNARAANQNGNDPLHVILDSFNSWTTGTQIESGGDYGSNYLNIISQEFNN